MKKLRLAALAADKAALMHRLQKLGCVELRPCPPPEGYLEAAPASDPEETLRELRRQQKQAADALKALNTYAYEKTGLFPGRELIGEADFFADIRGEARRAVGGILEAVKHLDGLHGEEAAAKAQAASLALWAEAPIPLELRETKTTLILLGSLPASVTAEALAQQLEAQVRECAVSPAGNDRHRNGVVVLCAKTAYPAAEPILRNAGFEQAPAAGLRGTAEENIRSAEESLEALARERQETLDYLQSCREKRRLIKLYYDRLTLEIDAAAAEGQLLSTASSFALTGWVDEPHVPQLEALLEDFCCAWELADPEPGDQVPIRLQNNRLTEPLNMVTEMYSLPDYHNIDPNPLIAPFFCIFFGMMFNDLGYGLLFIVLSLVAQKKFRLRGTIRHMVRLMLLCGITTALMGLLTGSFFGDSITVVAGMYGREIALPKLIDPLENPLQVLIISLVLGAVQLLFGMGVKAYLLIRDGKPLDALWDVGSWWVLFAGIALGVLKGFWGLALAGVLMLLLTQGRHKPTIGGKITGGLASLYDITSYFSDLLSYSRLMALMLAGGIVASIVNVLGSLFGSIILFIPIFIVGHLFNVGINVIGTYVHAARLQYLEFFGRFYEDGGKAFRPLERKTKYFEIVKEDTIHG